MIYKQKRITLKSFRFVTITVSLLSIGLSQITAAPTMEETRDIYKEYISIRKIIGEEKNAWESQKVTLDDIISVISTEIEQNKEIIETLESSATSADTKRSELNKALEQARRASSEFNSEIALYEARVLAITKRLPDILKSEVAPLTSRLPEDPSNTRLSYSQRLQTIIGLLAQIDKFNSDLRSVTEVKSLDDGSHEVRTLYFGLSSALFSNSAGTYAGYGKPGNEGWTWTTVSGTEAAAVSNAMEIYAARRAPAFVSVPIAID